MAIFVKCTDGTYVRISEVKRFRVREVTSDGYRSWVIAVSLAPSGEDFIDARAMNSFEAAQNWIALNLGPVI